MLYANNKSTERPAVCMGTLCAFVYKNISVGALPHPIIWYTQAVRAVPYLQEKYNCLPQQ